MDNTVEFKAWPKIPRGGEQERVIITEKIDGTNACIIIQEGAIAGVQSRNRFIKVGDDNYGFASWVERNKKSLLGLGEGYHYGEWAGPGIQKNPLELERKTLFLFNTLKWNLQNPNKPEICETVPVLYDGPFSADTISNTMVSLKKKSPNAEGVVAFYPKTKRLEKFTFKFSRGKWDV